MCGITGAYIFDSNKFQRLQDIELAVKTLNLRGPDASATYIDKQTALGHARLSIIDVTENANQPMLDTSGRYVIVFNGEIFNFKELRNDLIKKNIQLKTQSDTEVVLYLYITEGEKFVDKLNGFFAFAIYDKLENTIFIARDRMGIKPLVYYFDKEIFLFGSEIKSILQFGIDKKIDPTALYCYFQLNYIPAPKTMFENIKKLKPGHSILIKDNKITFNEFYKLPEYENHKFEGNYEQAQKQLFKMLDNAVVSQMISDVPLGSFLSGGIDSSVISGLASLHTNKLQTFSIGYKDEPFFDETHYAEIVAHHFRTEHTTFSLTNDDLLENLHDAINYFDEPFADSSALAEYILAKETRKHVTVALSGDGADEMFSGYHKHMAHLRASKNNFANFVIKNTSFLTQNIRGSRNSKIGNKLRQLSKFGVGLNLNPDERYWKWCSLLPAADTKNLLLQSIDNEDFNQLKNQYTQLITKDSINNILFADEQLVLPYDMLHKVDMMSMANSLEVRPPFLDYKIVEFANSLPEEFKINSDLKKRILQDTFRQFLPKELYNRPKKGFEVPLLKWFKRELNSYINENILEDNFIEEQNIFNQSSIKEIKQRLNSNNPGDLQAQIWALIVFQNWYKKYFI